MSNNLSRNPEYFPRKKIFAFSKEMLWRKKQIVRSPTLLSTVSFINDPLHLPFNFNFQRRCEEFRAGSTIILG